MQNRRSSRVIYGFAGRQWIFPPDCHVSIYNSTSRCRGCSLGSPKHKTPLIIITALSVLVTYLPCPLAVQILADKFPSVSSSNWVIALRCYASTLYHEDSSLPTFTVDNARTALNTIIIVRHVSACTSHNSTLVVRFICLYNGLAALGLV